MLVRYSECKNSNMHTLFKFLLQKSNLQKGLSIFLELQSTAIYLYLKLRPLLVYSNNGFAMLYCLWKGQKVGKVEELKS